MLVKLINLFTAYIVLKGKFPEAYPTSFAGFCKLQLDRKYLCARFELSSKNLSFYN
jgi:hypothetical protein